MLTAKINSKIFVKKLLLKTFYNVGGFAPFHRTMRDKILILMYHRFSAEKNPLKISSKEFAAHLEYLSKYHTVLPLTEAVDCLKNKKTLPPNAAVMTIDDGYADTFDIAFPLLKHFNLSATLFVVTDFLDGKCWLWTDLMRYVLCETKNENIEISFDEEDKISAKLLDKTQRLNLASRLNSRLKKMPDDEKSEKIKEIAKELNMKIPDLPSKDFAPISWKQASEMDKSKIQIESHTVSHPILTNINQERLDFELQTSKKILETNLDREVRIFCYPNGSLNESVRNAVKNAGYQCAVTTEYGFNSKDENLFLLKRIDASAEIEKFAQSASGFEWMRQRN